MAVEILVVDDEVGLRRELRDLLEDAGFSVREASDADGALEQVRERAPALVLLDIWLGAEAHGGLSFLERLRAEDAELPVVIISGHGTIETAVNSIKLGASDFVEKPFRSDQLLHIVRRALESVQLRRENEELRLRVGPETELVGETTAIRQLRDAVERVARTGSQVLVSGPAGSGKEVAARQLHKLSSRAEAPFLAIRCALMHPERLEEELFGREGGDRPRQAGLFDQAHGGTLFLDEVADMPYATQGKIVRALQEQRFHRIDSMRPVEVDVRIIAATTRDLESLVAEGAFREELLYRLNIVQLRVPPLSERRGDIPLLCEHFLGRAAENLGLAPRRLSEATLAVLRGCDWPGNVRQLRNVMDWLLIMTPGTSVDEIPPSALPPELRGEAPPALGPEAVALFADLPLREARERFEREYLARRLQHFDGRISQVAEDVGMERSALYRKLRSLGLVESPGSASDNR